MVDVKAVPPIAIVYHRNEVPVATKLATVAELQKVCDEAVGAVGATFIVTATNVLELSHVFAICDT